MRLRPRSSRFAQAVLVMGTGTAAAQALGLGFSPILTRMYGPEAFGVLALFTASVSLATPLASLRFEMGIPLEHDDERADDLTGLAFSLGVSSALLTGLAVLLVTVIVEYGGLALGRTGRSVLVAFWWFPLALLGASWFQVLGARDTRLGAYRGIASGAALRALLQGGGQSLLGLFVLPAGPVLAACVAAAHLFSSFCVMQGVKFGTFWRRRVRWKALVYRHRALAQYSALGAMASLAIAHIVPPVLALFVDFDVMGQFALAVRVLGVPTMLVGVAIGRVLYPELARAKTTGRVSRALVGDVAAYLGCMGALIYGGLAMHAPQLFGLVFGPGWGYAGRLAALACPGFAAYFVAMPLTSLVLLHGKERQHLWASLTMLGLRVTGIAVGASLAGVEGAVVAHSLTSLANAGFWMGWVARLTGFEPRPWWLRHRWMVLETWIALVLCIAVRLAWGDTHWLSTAILGALGCCVVLVRTIAKGRMLGSSLDSGARVVAGVAADHSERQDDPPHGHA